MDPVIFTALCSLIGTAVGSISGIFVTQKMTTYRLEVLEKRVAALEENDKRLYRLEQKNVLQDKIIETLEEKHVDLKRAFSDSREV